MTSILRIALLVAAEPLAAGQLAAPTALSGEDAISYRGKNAAEQTAATAAPVQIDQHGRRLQLRPSHRRQHGLTGDLPLRKTEIHRHATPAATMRLRLPELHVARAILTNRS